MCQCFVVHSKKELIGDKEINILSLSQSMWVCLCRPALCVVVFNGYFFIVSPISPIKEPRALRSPPHMAQWNPNVLCSLCEDVIASTLSALKDVI